MTTEKSLSHNASGSDHFFDDFVVPVRCEKCGIELREKVRQIKSGNTVTCPCGCMIDTSEVLARIALVDEAIVEFRPISIDLDKLPKSNK